jgi:Flp pilus assembly protein TadG
MLGRRRRDGRRGAAALELALSMFVLTPMLLGIIEYGYYFYIGINVVEAERAGLIAASHRTGVGATCATTTQAVNDATGAVSGYFGLNSLGSIVTVMSSSDHPSCATGTSWPTWSMSLIVDYRPLFGFTMPWEKRSPVTGYLRYRAGTLAMRGSP